MSEHSDITRSHKRSPSRSPTITSGGFRTLRLTQITLSTRYIIRYSIRSDIIRLIIRSAFQHFSFWDQHFSRGFTYVPKYLYYMVLELLKNSARATIETSSSQEEIEARPLLGMPWRLPAQSRMKPGIQEWWVENPLDLTNHKGYNVGI